MQTNPSDLPFAGFERHRPKLQAMAHGWLGSASDAQDAVQDTWLRAAALPHGPDCELAWLVTALRHVCIDRLRRRRLESRHAGTLQDPDDPALFAPSAEDVAARREETQGALRTLLSTLGGSDAAALLLHVAFDFEHAEIAELAGIPEATLRQRVHRALGRVRTRVSGVGTEPARVRSSGRPDDGVDEVFLTLCLRAMGEVKAAALVAAVMRTAPVQAAVATRQVSPGPAPRTTSAQVQVVQAGDALGLAWIVDGVVCCVVPLGPCAAIGSDEAAFAER